MDRERHLALVAGPFRIALPLVDVRQIVDVGGGDAEPPPAVAEEVKGAVSLAVLFGEAPMPWRPAVVRLDAAGSDLLVSCCRLEGFFDAGPPIPLPKTVAMRWPGLLAGALVRAPEEEGAPARLYLKVDARVLVGVVEAAS